MTTTEKDIKIEFKETTQELLQLLESLNKDELNQVPFEGSWTAAQVGDHLLRSYGVAEVIKGNTTHTDRAINEKIGRIKEVFLNFDIKMKSPDFIVPSNGWISKEELINGLKEKIAFLSYFIGHPDHDLSLTCLDFELPGAGTLTRSEWVQFMNVHTLRHMHQLKKIISKLK